MRARLLVPVAVATLALIALVSVLALAAAERDGSPVTAPNGGGNSRRILQQQKATKSSPLSYLIPICLVLYVLAVVANLYNAKNVAARTRSVNIGEFVPPVDRSLQRTASSNGGCSRNPQTVIVGVVLCFMGSIFIIMGAATSLPWLWPFGLIPATVGVILFTISGTYNVSMDPATGEFLVTKSTLCGLYSYPRYRENIHNLREGQFQMTTVVYRHRGNVRSRLVNLVQIIRNEGTPLSNVDGNGIRWEVLFGQASEMDNFNNFVHRYNGTAQTPTQTTAQVNVYGVPVGAPVPVDQRSAPLPPQYAAAGHVEQGAPPAYYAPPAAAEGNMRPGPFCNACGARNPPASRFCSGCGVDLHAAV